MFRLCLLLLKIDLFVLFVMCFSSGEGKDNFSTGVRITEIVLKAKVKTVNDKI